MLPRPDAVRRSDRGERRAGAKDLRPALDGSSGATRRWRSAKIGPRVNPPQVPATGSTFAGRYRVQGLLGEGGMGLVLRAEQLPGGRPVALKILTAEAAAVGESVARFRQEAQIASRIRNVHVVSVLDFGEAEGGRQYIAMELLEGIDLAALIEERGQLPMREAVALVMQGCAGVAAAHAQGLIHRDLKPANLFLARREGLPPVVKVLDFGLSKSLDTEAVRLTQTSMAMGTPLYMSPEQIVATKHVDARCDQHAMGMILFELLTGHPPYEVASVTALAVAIATHPPPSARAHVPELPAALDKVIQRALAKRPEDRFADLGKLAQAMAPFAPAGADLFARMIEDTLTPIRRPDAETAPTVQMSLPASLVVEGDPRRSGRTRKIVVDATEAAPPAGARDPGARPTASSARGSSTPATPQHDTPAITAERAAAVLTASPVSTDPHGRALAARSRGQTAMLLGGVVVGIALVCALTFAIISRAALPNAAERPATSQELARPEPTISTISTPSLPGPVIEPRGPAEPEPSARPAPSASAAASMRSPATSAVRPPTIPRRSPPSKKADPLGDYN